MSVPGSFSMLFPAAWTSAVRKRPHLQKLYGSMAHGEVTGDGEGGDGPLSPLYFCFRCPSLPGSFFHMSDGSPLTYRVCGRAVTVPCCDRWHQ